MIYRSCCERSANSSAARMHIRIFLRTAIKRPVMLASALALLLASCSSPNIPATSAATDSSPVGALSKRNISPKQRPSAPQITALGATSGLGSHSRSNAPQALSPSTIAPSSEPELSPDLNSGSSQDWKPMPRVGTPEWERKKLYDEQRERKVNQVMNSICRGC